MGAPLRVVCDKVVSQGALQASYNGFKQRMTRSQRNMRARLFPVSPALLVLIAGLISAGAAFGNNTTFGILPIFERLFYREDHPDGTRCLSLFFSSTFVALMLCQMLRMMLRVLFNYRGWMYETLGKPISLPTKIWMGIVELLSRCDPNTQSYQGLLPSLPVPSLDETVERHLRSMRPLLNDEEYARLEVLSNEFRNGLGRKLQRYLTVKSLIATNYVTDWWEEFVYLYQRSPLMINSNYYGLGFLLPVQPTFSQSARAANLAVAGIRFRELISRQEISPFSAVSKTHVPMCTSQYERLFNGCRIPGVEKDTLLYWEDVYHIAVYARGCWFKVLVHDGVRALDACEVQHQLDVILSSDLIDISEDERHLAALTAGERTYWAKTRAANFSSGINQQSLEVIESAAFVIILDDEEVHHDPKDSSKIDAWAHTMLHGKAYDRWFDKTLNITVTKNALQGFNSEHSWGDGSVVSHCAEFVLFHDLFVQGYDEHGNTKGTPRKLLKPERLRWELGDQAQEAIRHSLTVANKLIDDLEMAALIWTEYGKGLIKKLHVSPDAFLQMTLQLAYFKNQGKFSLTYEASMTRLFISGRTETVRSCTVESSEFVRAMLDKGQTREDRLRLLRVACSRHTELYKDAMSGMGVDRHLFALHVVKRYLNEESPFFDAIFPPSYQLSTSQTPLGQCGEELACVDRKKMDALVSGGGGFGPVAPDGYGVAYVLSGNDHLIIHTSSLRSCPTTSSKQMRADIEESLREMRALFVEDEA